MSEFFFLFLGLVFGSYATHALLTAAHERELSWERQRGFDEGKRAGFLEGRLANSRAPFGVLPDDAA